MTTSLGRSVAAALVALLASSLVACGSKDPTAPAAEAGTSSAATPLDQVGDVLPAKVVTYDALTRGSWVLSDFYGSGTSQGELELDDADGAEAKINWRKADQYGSYVEDRADLGASTKIVVLGEDSQMFSYSDDDHTVIRPVDGDAFLEIRVDGVDEAGFRAFIASLGPVTPQQWLATIDAAGLEVDAKGDSSGT